MTASLLTCPEEPCGRAWFDVGDAVDHLLAHLRRSHGHSEVSALGQLTGVEALMTQSPLATPSLSHDPFRTAGEAHSSRRSDPGSCGMAVRFAEPGCPYLGRHPDGYCPNDRDRTTERWPRDERERSR